MTTRSWLLGLGALLAFAAPSLLLPEPATAAQAKKAARKLKFEIYPDAAKEYRWRLKAANGQIIATSGEGYKAKADCRAGIDRIKSDVASDKLKFEVYDDARKESRWRLKAANGQIIATSGQGYKAKADCEHAIDVIKEGAAGAEVEDTA
jgi:uncharacterized protein YegP (UPF0339 family)